MARRPSPARRLPTPAPAQPASPPPITTVSAKPLVLWLCVASMVVLGIVAYSNGLTGRFFQDDLVGILENQDIRSIWSISSFRSSGGETPLLGRPLVTISFALNYAIDGLNVRGYHLVNIALHILCALVLFGVIRRASRSIGFGFVCASLWLLHPLNTEAVDYIVQRTELAMGLFYLLTIYCSIRAHGAARPTRWLALAVVATALGTLSKQSMVTVPVAAMLVDWTLYFGSLREALRRRWRFYTALATVSWSIFLVVGAISPVAHTAGFLTGMSGWVYLLNQTVMITRYLWLSIWPHALVVSYGYPRPFTLADIVPQTLFILTLIALTGVALRYRPKLGLLGAWVFLTLGVTSSFVPIATEVGAERRMYLALAALIVLAVLPFWRLWDILGKRYPSRVRVATIAAVGLWSLVAAAYTMTVMVRNDDYAHPLKLTRKALDRWPNGHTRHIYAVQLIVEHRSKEAMSYLREATHDDPRAHYTLGRMLYEAGQLHEAREELEEFIRLQPLLPQIVRAHANIADVLAAEGQLEAAADRYRYVLKLKPSYPNAHVRLGDILSSQRRFDEAIVEYRAALTAGNTNTAMVINLGVALWSTGRADEAVEALRRAIEGDPKAGQAHRNLAAMLMEKGETSAALPHAEKAAELMPADPLAHDLFGVCLATAGRLDDAVGQFRRALTLAPTDAQIAEHLKDALAARRRDTPRTAGLAR